MAIKNDLEILRNIGPKVAQWLNEVGIHTPEQLAEVGSVNAYLRIRELGERNSTNIMALYALEGALLDISCLTMDEELKAELRRELAAATQSPG